MYGSVWSINWTVFLYFTNNILQHSLQEANAIDVFAVMLPCHLKCSAFHNFFLSALYSRYSVLWTWCYNSRTRCSCIYRERSNRTRNGNAHFHLLRSNNSLGRPNHKIFSLVEHRQHINRRSSAKNNFHKLEVGC